MNEFEDFLHLFTLQIVELDPIEKANTRYSSRVGNSPTLPIVFDALIRGDLVSLSWIKAEYPELFENEYTLCGKKFTPLMYLSMILSTERGRRLYNKKTILANYLTSTLC